MKYLICGILMFFLLWSCEEDDICIDDKSPRMYLKFENLAIEDSVRMDSLFIWRQNLNNAYELYIARSKPNFVDSILVPLPIAEVEQAKFVISPSFNEISSRDTLTVNYDRQLEFGSKACGYKVTYLNVNYDITNHFFVASEAIDTNITDEQTPDLLLYF